MQSLYSSKDFKRPRDMKFDEKQFNKGNAASRDMALPEDVGAN
jgi:hypothetical protein